MTKGERSIAVVTGGCGFVGSHLVRELLRRGWYVRVIDDLSAGRFANLPRLGDLLPIGKMSLTVGDITTSSGRSALGRLCVGADIVFHLAAQASVAVSVRDPVADAESNVLGTVYSLEAARAAGARVVFASTGGAIYGECGRPAGEDDPTRPASPYGIAKLAGEAYVLGWGRAYGQENLVLRYANVYGPLQRGDGEAGVVSMFAHKIAAGLVPLVYGDGAQTRDFVYVTDVARATVMAAERGLSGVYNVGTGVETSVSDLAGLVWGAAGGDEAFPSAIYADARPGDLRRSVVSPDAIRDAIGWEPSVGLEDGVARTYAWVLAGSELWSPA